MINFDNNSRNIFFYEWNSREKKGTLNDVFCEWILSVKYKQTIWSVRSNGTEKLSHYFIFVTDEIADPRTQEEWRVDCCGGSFVLADIQVSTKLYLLFKYIF